MAGSLCVKVHVSPSLQSGVRLELVSAMTSGSQSWPPSMLTEVYKIADYNNLIHYLHKGCKLLLYPGAFNLATGPLHWELLIRGTLVNFAHLTLYSVLASLYLL